VRRAASTRFHGWLHAVLDVAPLGLWLVITK
jgi:hypothetical protein